MMFQNRNDAGKKLSGKLLDLKSKDTVVVALPRGGVVVGFEIASALKSPLTMLNVRKLGSPTNPEFGIGAITSGGITYIDKSTVERIDMSNDDIEKIASDELQELKRRDKLYSTALPKISLAKKIVILTDDGIATGVTISAAILAIKKMKPKCLILAVPGGPSEVIAELRNLVDEVFCLEVRDNFSAVGNMYFNFEQVTNDEVVKLLREANKKNDN